MVRLRWLLTSQRKLLSRIMPLCDTVAGRVLVLRHFQTGINNMSVMLVFCQLSCCILKFMLGTDPPPRPKHSPYSVFLLDHPRDLTLLLCAVQLAYHSGVGLACVGRVQSI